MGLDQEEVKVYVLSNSTVLLGLETLTFLIIICLASGLISAPASRKEMIATNWPHN